VNTNWNFEDEFMWKGMSPSYINLLTPAQGVGYLMPSTISNIGNEEKLLEGVLRDKISAIRRNDENLSTAWDNHLSYLLSTALINYENERLGISFLNSKTYYRRLNFCH
jgi:hypothetical protein